jgi:hypothetical protein
MISSIFWFSSSSNISGKILLPMLILLILLIISSYDLLKNYYGLEYRLVKNHAKTSLGSLGAAIVGEFAIFAVILGACSHIIYLALEVCLRHATGTMPTALPFHVKLPVYAAAIYPTATNSRASGSDQKPVIDGNPD